MKSVKFQIFWRVPNLELNSFLGWREYDFSSFDKVLKKYITMDNIKFSIKYVFQVHVFELIDVNIFFFQKFGHS